VTYYIPEVSDEPDDSFLSTLVTITIPVVINWCRKRLGTVLTRKNSRPQMWYWRSQLELVVIKESCTFIYAAETRHAKIAIREWTLALEIERKN